VHKFLPFLLLSLFALPASATNAVFINQSGGGAGTSCGSAQSAAYFNNASNWNGSPTGVQIGPDSTVHLCPGSITTSLSWQGSGTSGHPITMFFESGAKLSQPFCGQGGGTSCMALNANSWLVIDGGVPCGINTAGVPISEATCNGIVEANNNGTVLVNQNGENSGITANGASNFEIKNLDVRNIYVRSGTTDHNPDANNGERPYAIELSGASNYSIHDGKAHDANWSLTSIQCSGNVSNISIYNEDTYNDNHGVAVGVCANSATNVTIHNSHFGSMTNWDDPPANTSSYHHDGIHVYVTQPGGSVTGLSIYANQYDGDWGVTNTAHNFLEGPVSGNIFDNLFISGVGQHLSNGSINNVNSPSGTKNIGYYNNTHIYLDTNDAGGPVELVGNVDMRNNVITTADTNNPTPLEYSGTGTVDYNVYASSLPGAALFAAIGTCCQWTYAVWQAGGVGHTTPNDTHSPAIQTPPAGLNIATGVPNSGSPVIGAGTNLTSLCTGSLAPLCSDKNGNARPPSGNWTAGAINFGGNLTPTKPPAGVWFQ
jgi:hypothetical protein